MNRILAYKYALVSGLLILATVNLTRTSLQILQTSKKIENMDSDISLLEQEKQVLEESIEYKQTSAYIEEKARNELNLVKPNEELFLVPGLEGKSNPENRPSGINVLGATALPRNLTSAERKENLIRWFDLFF